jgi:hypothetical protein
MRSSPPESIKAEQDLRELLITYDLALEALLREDLVRCRHLLGETERILARLPSDVGNSPKASSLRTAAAASQGRVGAALQAALLATEAEMAKVRRGQKALRGYGDPTRGIGDRLQSRG